MHVYQVIRRPIITEKTRYLADAHNQYVFEVDQRANKRQIREAVETAYKVKVVRVNVMRMPAKTTKRWGRRRVVRRSPWKKAVVTLAEEDEIAIFRGG